MWSYYGSKSKVINLYPPPKFGKVIEPFAGSARYALKYFDRDVLLVDKYDVIVKIWKWLQVCSPNDILKLPRLKPDQTLNDFTFDCDEARLLMGFLIAGAGQIPRNKPTDRTTIHRPNSINFRLKFIASNLFKIKHWKIELDSYENIPNQEATWFIDPPYQVGGYVYKENNDGWDYSKLAEWCVSRKGHVIVCENTSASWLPFLPMKKMRGSIMSSTEVIWSNFPTTYNFQQQSLFAETRLTQHAPDKGGRGSVV
jgi:site-specific DNA-adenine methylase